ncbi:MAG: chemotaxis protein CheW, partial [Proteobacteria bacterium]|nr:chemotaxis protein CheW [Pseudomonadota bacterium]
MSPTHGTLAEALRADFDAAFIRAPEQKIERMADLLGITLFGAAYALKLQDVAGLYAGKKIARVPGSKPGLLGIAGFRGAILPVYDLAALIGLPASVRPKWLAVAKSGDIAIAFDSFDGHLRVPEAAVAVNEYKDGVRQYVSHLTQSKDGLRGVIDLDNALKPVAV